MAFSFNPFFRVMESGDNRFSRLYRKTWWEKIQDTFYVIAGNRGFGFLLDAVSKNDGGETARPGILDYVTFQLTRMINKVTFWSWNNVFNDPIALLLILPASGLFIAANVIHYTLAATLTLIASPIVSTVHFFSQLLGGWNLKNEAEKLHGKTFEEYATRKVAGDTFSSFLKGTGHSYSDIIIDLKRASKEEDNLELLFMESHHKYQCCIDGDCEHQKGHIQFSVDLNNLQDDDKIAIKALLKLNAGHIKDNLEEQNRLDHVKELVKLRR